MQACEGMYDSYVILCSVMDLTNVTFVYGEIASYKIGTAF